MKGMIQIAMPSYVSPLEISAAMEIIIKFMELTMRLLSIIVYI